MSGGEGTVFALSGEEPGLDQRGWSLAAAERPAGASGGELVLFPPSTHAGHLPMSLPPPAQLQFLRRQPESGSAFVQLPEGRKQTPVTAEVPHHVSADLSFPSS